MTVSEVDLLIKGGSVVSPWGVHPADVAVVGERIVGVLEPGIELRATRVIDATGKHLLPGAIDTHMHMNRANRTVESCCQTETPSMVMGGITTCIAHAETHGSYLDSLPVDIKAVNRYSLIDVAFHICMLEPNHIEEIPEVRKRFGVCSFKHWMGPAWKEVYAGIVSLDDGTLLQSFKTIRASGPGGRALVHAENLAVCDILIEELRASGRTEPAAWTDARPDYAEEEAMGRAAILALNAGCPLFFVHCSTREASQVITEFRSKGLAIDGETCPHYLTIHRSHPLAALAKYNPSIKDEEDNAALWQGIRDGTIVCTGSDHIPIRRPEKTLDAPTIWGVRLGLPGSGTILPTLLSQGVSQGRISLEQLAAVTSYHAARLFRLPRKGLIASGYDADIVVVDLDKEVKYRPELLGLDVGLFDGWSFKGWPEMTLLRGTVVADHGEIVAQHGIGRYARG